MRKNCKNLLMILTALMMILSMSACSNKDLSIDINSMMNDATKAAEFQDEMVEIGDDIISNVYTSINPDDLDEYKIITSSTSVKAEEIAIFKAKNADSADKVLKAVEERLDDMKLGFEGYLPEELKIAENAILRKEGNYVIFAVGQNYTEIDKVFNNYVNK